MNIAKIELTINEKKFSGQLQFSETQLIISDKLILSVLKDTENNKITSCNIILGVNDIAIRIVDYTLTDTISFSAFYNISSNISIFQSNGTNVHIVNQKVDLMQLDCQKILIADCQIRHLYIGIAEHHKALNESSLKKDSTLPTAYKMKSIDLRECQIETLMAYVECDSVEVRGGIINTFNFIGGFGSKIVAVIQRVHLWQHVSIGVSEICCKITDFKIQESTISNLAAKAYCKIDNFDINNSVIINTYDFEKRHFHQHNKDTWLLISKSAQSNRNLNARAEANYNISKEIYKNEKGINKITAHLFGFCTGYGYKPTRAFFSCLIIIIAAFLISTMNDLICFGSDATKYLLSNFKISIAAIAGQSGLLINDGFKFWLATGEYVLGIIIFAMFVNALYVRYKD